jgi:hypothetical protein
MNLLASESDERYDFARRHVSPNLPLALNGGVVIGFLPGGTLAM